MSKETENVKTDEKPKKGFSLKSMFFSEDTPKASEPKNVVQETVTPQPQPVAQPTYGTNTVGVVNPEIYTMLKRVLEECNLPGPDYLELKSASDAMKLFLPDESQRFIAAFASLKATSPKLTKSIVLSSIDEYIKFIENERVGSEGEFKSAFDTEITKRQNDIDGYNAEIERLKKIITDSQDAIVKLSQTINTTSGEMLSKQNELDIKKKNFDASIGAIIGELNSDKIKIQTLISE